MSNRKEILIWLTIAVVVYLYLYAYASSAHCLPGPGC